MNLFLYYLLISSTIYRVISLMASGAISIECLCTMLFQRRSGEKCDENRGNLGRVEPLATGFSDEINQKWKLVMRWIR